MPYVKKSITINDIENLMKTLALQPIKLSSEPVCDFCGNPHVRYMYAAKRLSTGEFCECWRWCACEDCSKAVDSVQWGVIENKLADRLQMVFTALLGGLPNQSLRRTAAEKALQSFHKDALVEKGG